MKFIRHFLAILLILATSILQAQHMETTPLFSPEAEDHSDLAFLKPALEDKRVVMLGEMTHMYGNIFEMKARMVEFLHQELGFTTIAMEASMYDLWLMTKENPDFEPEEFNEAIFGVWSQSEEFQRLVNYIDEHELKVTGFDSQVVRNVPEFIDGFFEFCRKQDIKIRLDQDDMGIAMEEVLEGGLYVEDDISFSKFEKELHRIIDQMEKLPDSDENFHWLQFSKSLLASAQDIFYEEEITYKSDYANSNHNFRDAQMADNLLSYMERHPKEKIIVWADNIHIVNDLSGVNDPVLKKFVSMGHHIKKALGDQVYSLATLHANDSLFDGKIWHQTPILQNSFEGKLASLGEPFLFVDSSQEALQQPQQNRLLNYVHFHEARLDQLYDGYIFLKHASLPQHKKQKLAEVQGEEEEENLLHPETAKAKRRILEARLLDSETMAPVPYATLILLGGDLYRISDGEGNFQIPISKNVPEDAVLQISSMGYETKGIAFSELTEEILLHPQLEQLSEVVITAYNTSPKKVLKKVIKRIEEQYFMEPHNFTRYGHFVLNRNDEKLQDLEIITTDYSEGAREKEPVYHRVEQVKWNLKQKENNYEHAASLSGFREDAVQFASILHKRRYKKFELEFVTSGKPEDQGLYIIKFSTDKTRFGYTNRWYPTAYSGLIYVNKEDHGVVKVVQNWDTEIDEADVEKVKYWLGDFRKFYRGKTEMVSIYSRKQGGKYHTKEYFIRRYSEKTNMEGEFVNYTFEGRSHLSDFTDENLLVLTWENRSENSLLDRVEFDESFWGSFEGKDKMSSTGGVLPKAK